MAVAVLGSSSITRIFAMPADYLQFGTPRRAPNSEGKLSGHGYRPRGILTHAMKWITRQNVKVDRVACPWLIRRFVDPQAEFIFVPAEQVAANARELGATPFDIEGCELGHHGEYVSFDSILKKYRLDDPALHLLAEIVRAADSHPANPQHERFRQADVARGHQADTFSGWNRMTRIRRGVQVRSPQCRMASRRVRAHWPRLVPQARK